MKQLFTLLFLTGLYSVGFAQPTAPIMQWEKSFGGRYTDEAFSIQQTSDGGYVVAGYSYSDSGDVTGNHGLVDYWVVKLNYLGVIQWQRALGGSSEDHAFSIQQTNDGGYIVAGTSSSSDGDVTSTHRTNDYWVVKLNNAGAIQWQKALGGTGYENGGTVQQTNDGGYIVCGGATSNDGDVTGNHGDFDGWIVKLNAYGAIQWQKSLGGTGTEAINVVRQTSDGGYITIGGSESTNGDVLGNHGNIDYWIVKLDGTGAIQWKKCLGGSGFDEPATIRQTADGGYIAVGRSESTDGDVTGNRGGYDYWIVKLNSTGGIQWQKSFGGSGYDLASDVWQTTDGGYIVSGRSNSSDGDVFGNYGSYDYWIIKLNSTGSMQWQKLLGGAGYDEPRAVQQTSDGGYVLAGFSSSADLDVTSNQGEYDYWIVKLGFSPLATTNANSIGALSLRPNPTTDIVHLQSQETIRAVRITDLSGREIYHSGILNTQNVTIPTASFAKGMYLLRATTAQGTTIQKFEVR